MSQSLTLITSAAEEPVTLADLKGHIINASTDQDDDLSLKLLAARQHIERELQRAIITSTWQFSMSSWPCKPYMEFPLGNLQSVTWVKFAQPGSALTPLTWDPANYILQRTYNPIAGVDDAGIGRLYHGYNIPWPPGPLDVGESICAQFVAGWADAASVPGPLKQAILMVADHFYRNRSAVIADRGVVSEEIALGVDRLIAPYRIL